MDSIATNFDAIFFPTELLERVLLRLGTTETDLQLEAAVNKFLTPVLLKITSTNETVRCKVRHTVVDKPLPKRVRPAA